MASCETCRHDWLLSCITAMTYGSAFFLLLPGGEERRIHAAVPSVDDKERDGQERVEVLFLGEGTVPSDLT
ncbi:hypothetical protein AR457_41380 [Streptomyces agglomeratus]|uniref:Uncharacterized protein n=2 Tax=Streptomyces agglomeratus TaxID=285458 RepID=A0A1E5NY63_9ACTN|nr:hypothetical protein [Streptomyces agglomeratus]OEJ21157.1 hypothetical protein AR457_41380 [Streptomyces agglomeratus]OEJ21209.1 hypothetical protein AS594_36855 [Streptomyces agglomeratus]OEJ36596.1 hypothetical protein BGK72_36040 [Streptomyces agglomeratus]OEJ56314.1 hypothetical protein BGM19_36915 [Streptomyces agglomeratus]